MSASLARSRSALALLLALVATVLLASCHGAAAAQQPAFRNTVQVLNIDDLPDLDNEQATELGLDLDFNVGVEHRQTFTVSDAARMRPAALKEVESLPAMSNEEDAREFARWVLDASESGFGTGSGDSDESSTGEEWSEPSSTGMSSGDESSSGSSELSSSGGSVEVIAPSSLVLSVTGTLSVAQYGSVRISLESYSGSAPTEFSITPALSSGLTLSTANGTIFGHANAQPSTVAYTLTARNAAGSANASFTLVITAVAPSSLVLSGVGSYSLTAFETVATSIVASVSGSMPFIYSVTPSLPTGLSIAATTGFVTGAATVVSSATYTLTVTNGAGSVSRTFNLTVTAAAPSALVLSASSVVFTDGVANTVTVSSIAGSLPVVYTVTPTLPTGLAIDAATGTISGKASTLQSAIAYTVTATNAAGSTTATVSIAVVARAPSSLVLSTYAAALVTGATSNSIVRVVSIVGTTPITYTVTPTLPAGLSLSSNGTISGAATTPQEATSYVIKATNAVGSVTATLSISVVSSIIAPSALTLSTSSAVYVLTVAQTVTVSSVVGTQPMSYAVTPSLPSGLSINVLTGAISGTALVAQSATAYTVTASNSAGSTSASLTIRVNVVAPAGLALSSSTATLRVSQAASITATVTAGTAPLVYTVSPALPSGLAISSSTGAISGTPTVVASSTVYTVTAGNSAGSTTANVTLTVALLAPSALTFAASSLELTAGVYGSVGVNSIAGSLPVVYTVTPVLPTGLSISNVTGTISGVTTVLQSAAAYTVTATNSAGSTAATVSIAVLRRAPSSLIMSTSAVVFVAGVSGTTITVSSVIGTAPFTYTVTPTLPTGLSIDANTGAISGTATAAATAAAYTVTAANSRGNTTAVVYITALMLAPRSLSLSVTTVAFVRNEMATAITATVTGNFITYTVSPTLPAGLSMNSATGAISGTPTALATSTLYTVTATNAGGAVTAGVTIEVVAAITPPSALVLSTASLSMTVGVAGSVTVTSVLGTPAFTYSVQPSLPTGLTISSSTGTISGTVTSAVASALYTVKATNSAGSTTFDVRIAVVVVKPTALSMPSSMTFYVGTSNTVSVTSIAGTVPVTYTISPTLPAGLAISSATGQIAGTATAAQAATVFNVTATNSAGSTTATITITVSLTAPSALTYAASSLTFTSKVAGTALTVSSVKGSAPITYSISPSLPTGVAISAVSGRISGTPSAGAALPATVFTVTATNGAGSANATITITVNVVAPSSLELSAPLVTFVAGIANSVTVMSVSGTTPMVYTISPTPPTGVSINNATGTISGTTTAKSDAATYTVTATNAAGSTTTTVSIQAVLNIEAPSAIELSSSSVTLATGATAAVSVSAWGTAPFVWTVSPSLPTGLTLSSSTGAISGSSAAAVSTATYIITATNAGGSANASLVLAVVVQAPSALTYASSSFTFTAGASSRFPVGSISGSLPMVYTVTGLPTGLAINSATGTIRGTVSGQVAEGTNSYTVTATNSMGSTSVVVTITVVVIAPSALVMDSNSVTFTAGLLGAVGVRSINGSGPFNYTLTSGSLPTGLSLSTAGRIYGSPISGMAQSLFEITASNSKGSTTALFYLTISVVPPSALQLTTDAITFTSGFPNSVSVLSVSGTLPMTYSVSPALPPGLSLSSTTGTISGDGLETRVGTYTVTATNAAGSTHQTVAITVQMVAPSALTLSKASVTAVVGIATSVTVVSVVGTVPMTYTVAPALPTGLMLSPSTGTISGAISAAQSATTYTVTATNSEGSATATVSIAATSAAATFVPVGFSYSSPSAVYIINSKIPANKPTVVGAGPFTYTISSTSQPLPAGLSLSTTGYIKGTPTAISALQTYTIIVSNPYGSATAQVSLEVTATPPSEFSYQYSSIGYLIGTALPNAPSVSGTTTGMTYTVGAGDLPAGITLDAATGIMSGVPATNGGTFVASGRVTIFATNAGGKAATVVSWSVSDVVIAPSDFSYPVATLAYPDRGADSTAVPVFFGTAPTFTVSPALPAGMALGEFSGVISGLPTEVGSQEYTVTATNSAGSVSTPVTITITQVPPQVVVYASRFSAYTVGVAVTNAVTMTPAIGSEAAGTYTFTAPVLPAGLTIDARTGVVSGTPTEKSDGTAYTVTVSNTQGSLTFELNIRVLAADAVVVRTPSVPAALGFPMSLASFTTALREQMLQEFANKVGLHRALISLTRAYAPVLLSTGFHTEGVASAFHVQRAAAGTASSRFATADTETGGLSVELAIDTSSTDSSAVEDFIVQQQEAEEFELPTFGAASVSSTVTTVAESSSGVEASSSGTSGSSGTSASGSSGASGTEASSGESVLVGDSAPTSSFTWGSAGGVVVAIIITLACAAVLIGAFVLYRRCTSGDKRLSNEDVLVEVVSPGHGHHAMDVSPEHAAHDASQRAFAPSAASVSYGAADASAPVAAAPAADAPVSLHYSS